MHSTQAVDWQKSPRICRHSGQEERLSLPRTQGKRPINTLRRPPTAENHRKARRPAARVSALACKYTTAHQPPFALTKRTTLTITITPLIHALHSDTTSRQALCGTAQRSQTSRNASATRISARQARISIKRRTRYARTSLTFRHQMSQRNI